MGAGFRSHDSRPPRSVSAQTGPMVITKGRIVSLAEFELRSKAWKTRTVPKSRTASAIDDPDRPSTVSRSGQRRSVSPVTEFLDLLVTFLFVMKALFGLHMPNYTFPGVPNEDLFDRFVHQAKAAENGRLRPRDRDGPLLSDPRHRSRNGTDDGGVHDARRARREHHSSQARDARHRGDLSQPGDSRQAGHHARRDLERPRHLRHRGRLERGRAQGLWR